MINNTKRYDPGDRLKDHLIFVLKFEGINLEILNALFLVVDHKDIEHFIKETPAGKYARKIWFLYEYLMGRELDLQPSKTTKITLISSIKTNIIPAKVSRTVGKKLLIISWGISASAP